jgi:hypothetical protein
MNDITSSMLNFLVTDSSWIQYIAQREELFGRAEAAGIWHSHKAWFDISWYIFNSIYRFGKKMLPLSCPAA